MPLSSKVKVCIGYGVATLKMYSTFGKILIFQQSPCFYLPNLLARWEKAKGKGNRKWPVG
jgi:hypothetical protein